MAIEENDWIEWKNGTVGIGASNATFLNADNLNKINSKTKEALETLDTLAAENLTEFQRELEEGDIEVKKANIAINDVNGNPIATTYTSKNDFNLFESQIKNGEVILGRAQISNQTLRVTESLGADVVVLGETPAVGTATANVATTAFVTNTFNKALNDALE